MKEAYNAMGGLQRKYRDLKVSLLQWYKAQSVGCIQRYQADFKQLAMKTGETFKLYCMRLQEVAHRAYPGDERECARQLKIKIMKSIPSLFVKCLEKKEDMKGMLHLSKTVTWGEIIQIDERQDRKLLKKQLVEAQDSDDDLQIRLNKLKCQMIGMDTPTEPVVTKVFKNSKFIKRSPSRHVIVKHCERTGHDEQECWRKKGACIICGSREHPFKECLKYVPNYRKPSCINCMGQHWAKDCPRRLLNP